LIKDEQFELPNGSAQYGFAKGKLWSPSCFHFYNCQPESGSGRSVIGQVKVSGREVSVRRFSSQSNES
jgi:hypothetical protein